jgi:hypothetical protein
VQDKARDIVSIKDFNVLTTNTGSVNVTNFNAATAASAAAGTALYAPGNAAVYQFNADLVLPAGTKLYGDGKTGSIFEFSHTGNGLISSSPINVSANTFIDVDNLYLRNTNGLNVGGGFVVEGPGAYNSFTRIRVTGFKYGAILDQAELTDIDLCHFQSCLTGGVWLVNGPDRRVGTSTFFTNRNSISRCQFNLSPWGIIDDGGYTHAFERNNFNGGTNHIRLSGAVAAHISKSELEGATGTNIVFSQTTLAGASVGASFLSIEDCIITPAAGGSAGSFAGGGSVYLKNIYSSTTGTAWINAALPSTVTSINCYNPSGALFDSAVGASYVNEMNVSALARIGGLAQRRFSLTYGATVAVDASQGNFGELIATNGTAFTMANPTNGRNGQALTLTISNTSGGVLGAITWGVNYKMSAWTSPATGNNRSITFMYDGTNWNERSRTAADVPN